MFLLFLIVTSTYAEDYYTNKEENLPVLGQEQSVYFGDRMIIQRYGYFEKCLTPKKSLEFQRLMTVNQCFLSTRRFERKNRYGDMYQIEKDGVMCGESINWLKSPTEPVELGIKLKDTYYPIAGRKSNDTWAVIVSALRIKLSPTISSPLLTE